jgi:hypothetical protein
MKRYLALCAVLAFGMTACGADGLSTLVSTADEPAGANCANGGIAVSIGPDGNGDAILDASEVATTRYLCDGASGSNGTDGTDGTNGTDGNDGNDGESIQTLVSTTDEAAGDNCASGGQRIDYGTDDDANETLDSGEIDGTTYVCDGAVGENGDDGDDGDDGFSSAVAVSGEEPGENCEFGGQRIDYGTDDNGTPGLDAEEIDGTSFVCDAPGEARYAMFTSNGIFVPPAGVTRFRVLVVGGGGGGTGSHYLGGGSGHVRVGEFEVTGTVAVTVGLGGAGADRGNEFSGGNGERSSFGTFLVALGGEGGAGNGDGGPGGGAGGAGGSGGGGAGNDGFGGNGGSAGSNGGDGASYEGGLGGNFDDLGGFTAALVAPGAGGRAGVSTNSGGGGGGGVLINWANPTGESGAASYSGRGGEGYGGGGGAGGYDAPSGYARGGAGANGVVYIEW